MLNRANISILVVYQAGENTSVNGRPSDPDLPSFASVTKTKVTDLSPDSESGADVALYRSDESGEALVESVAWIRRALPRTPLFVLTDAANPDTRSTLLRAGVESLLPGAATSDRLEKAIMGVLRGENGDRTGLPTGSEQDSISGHMVSQRLNAIIQTSSDAIFSYTLDGTVTTWNPGAVKMYGYSADEMIGESIERIIREARISELDEFAQILSTGESISNYTSDRIRKDGSGLHVSLSISPLFDAQGDVVGASTIARDITSEVESTRIAKRNNELLQVMGRLAQVGGWEMDVETMSVRSTDEVARIHDLDPSYEFDFQKALSYLSEESREKTSQSINTALKDGKEYSIDLDMTTATGNEKTVRVVGHPESSDGEVVRIWGAIQDITERKRIEREIKSLNATLEEKVRQRTAQLTEVNEELKAFSYSVSHDLRSPLRSVDGFAKILLNKYTDDLPEKARHYLGRIVANTREMGDLIDDLLRFSRLQRRALKKWEFDPTDVAREVIDSLEEEINAYGATIELDDLPRCCADRSMIKQVFVNLLSNALKFSRDEDSPIIEIGTAQGSGTVEYFVRDNGVGFDMNYAGKLFDVFQRLHPKQEFEGTGVGLALVQRILHRHDGTIRGESTPGEGATFFFSLPVDNAS